MFPLLEGFVPVVQALIVIEVFVLMVLVARNRRAAINLTLFLLVKKSSIIYIESELRTDCLLATKQRFGLGRG